MKALIVVIIIMSMLGACTSKQDTLPKVNTLAAIENREELWIMTDHLQDSLGHYFWYEKGDSSKTIHMQNDSVAFEYKWKRGQ